MREKRKEKDVFLRRMGVVLPLIEYVVKADIFLDMLALIFTGFNDSAENVLLRCLLAPRIVIFGPLFYLAMFYGGQASDASFRAMGQERAKTSYIRVAVCAAAGGVGVLGALVTAIVIAYFLSLPLPLPWEGFALVFEMICEILLILAAVRAKKRAEALKGVADWYEIKGAKLIEANLWLENGKRDRKAKKKEAGI